MQVRPAPHVPSCETPADRKATAEFERLYHDYHARIYNLCARIIGDRDYAADVTQEVFLRAYMRLPTTADASGAKAWLYRVAVNASYDHLRRCAARPASSLDCLPDAPSGRDPLQDAELSRVVEGCLAALTPRYRAALVLKDLHGLSTQEVGQALGSTPGATRVVLHRARAAFRRAFRETAPGAGSVSALGLAALLPELAAPPSLQTPPWTQLAQTAAAPAGPPAPTPPISAASQAPLSSGSPAAAVPVSLTSIGPSGLLAGLGSAVGVKSAVAVIAAVIATGGGLAVDHHSHSRTPSPTAASVIVTSTAGVVAPSANARQDAAIWDPTERRPGAIAPRGGEPGPARSGPASAASTHGGSGRQDSPTSALAGASGGSGSGGTNGPSTIKHGDREGGGSGGTVGGAGTGGTDPGGGTAGAGTIGGVGAGTGGTDSGGAGTGAGGAHPGGGTASAGTDPGGGTVSGGDADDGGSAGGATGGDQTGGESRDTGGGT